MVIASHSIFSFLSRAGWSSAIEQRWIGQPVPERLRWKEELRTAPQIAPGLDGSLSLPATVTTQRTGESGRQVSYAYLDPAGLQVGTLVNRVPEAGETGATPEDLKAAMEKKAAEAKKTAKKTKKKEKVLIPHARVKVRSTFNNTIVTITDQAGNVLGWASGGKIGFKGSR